MLLFVRIRGTSSLNVSRAERMTVENVCTLIHHRLRSDRTREMLLKHGVKLMSMETPCVSSLDSHARTIPEVKKKVRRKRARTLKGISEQTILCVFEMCTSQCRNPKIRLRIQNFGSDESTVSRKITAREFVICNGTSKLHKDLDSIVEPPRPFVNSNQLYFIEDMERDDVADNIWRRRRVYKPSAGALSDSSSTTSKKSADNIMIATPSESSRDAEMLRIWREKAEKCDEFKQRAQKAEKELESLRKRLKNFGGESIPRIDDTVYKKN